MPPIEQSEQYLLAMREMYAFYLGIARKGNRSGRFAGNHLVRSRSEDIVVALRYPPEVGLAVEEVSNKYGLQAPMICCNRAAAHSAILTGASFPQGGLSQESPGARKTLSLLTEGVCSALLENPELSEAPESVFGPFITGEHIVLLAGMPNYGVWQLTKRIYEACSLVVPESVPTMGGHTVALPVHGSSLARLLSFPRVGTCRPVSVDVGVVSFRPYGLDVYSTFPLA